MEDQEEMTPEELATLFGEPVPVEPPPPQFPDEEIYAVSARIKNLATLAVGTNLTPVGVSLCNTYTHVVKAFYGFANTLPDADRDRLKALIRHHEGMAADFVASVPPPQRPKREPAVVLHNVYPNVAIPDDENTTTTWRPDSDLDVDTPGSSAISEDEARTLLRQYEQALQTFGRPAPLPLSSNGVNSYEAPKPSVWMRFWDWLVGNK